MKALLKAASLALALAAPLMSHAQAGDGRPATPQGHYEDAETQTILDWQRVVQQANDYRYRKAAEEAARTGTVQPQPTTQK
jgi:hypothetical protein